MRWIWGLALLAALSACSKEPDFDERFEKASAEIDLRVKALDAAVSEGDAAKPQGPIPTAERPDIKLLLPVAELTRNEGGSSGE